MKESDFKKKLSEEEYHVLREKGTEAPFSGKYAKFDKKGKYVCKACGNVLFDSGTKFDSSCGWPSFYDAIPGRVEFNEDNSHLMHRIEVVCSKCKSHLGHVFDDGPNPTGKRFCINSVSIDFKDKGDKK